MSSVDTPSHEQLMEDLRRGNTAALDELYERYAQKLYVFCRHAMFHGSPEDCQDLVQDVFMRVIKAAHRFDSLKGLFRTWIFRIARNRCIDAVRRQKWIRFISFGEKNGWNDREKGFFQEDTVADTAASSEQSAVAASVAQAVRGCMDALENEQERQAIVLYYLHEKVYRQIGEILGESTSMVRNRVKAAQKKVKRCLEAKGIRSTSEGSL